MKILYLFDASDWESRMAVAYGARDQGHDVVIGLINGDEGAQDKAPDFKVVCLRRSGQKIGVIAALYMVCDIEDLIRKEAPDITHTVTLKYGFMAGLASRTFQRMRKIHTLAGLGYVFRSGDFKSRILQLCLKPFLKYSLGQPNTTLIFQNPDDLDLMIQKGYAMAENSALIRGSGVYLDRFNTDTPESTPPIVLMPTRLVHEKGVAVFIEAARILKERGVEARFQIAGGETNHNPKAISGDEMKDMISCGSVEWLGRVSGMPDVLARAAMIVYPSYYGEGIPRVLLESCAAGKAIVTTDHPGCREAVDHEKNGLLVPVKDAHATAEAIQHILDDPQLRAAMGQASRSKAEAEFNIHDIVLKTVAVYG